MTFANTTQKTKIKTTTPLLLRSIAGILVFFILTPSLVAARTFNPHNIITDQELFNTTSLSKASIQRFLEREGSVLANYNQVVNGQSLKASEMIWQVSSLHGINPKFILTTLEKEQGLVQRSTAPQKTIDWATGYSCFNGGCNEKHRGFYNQIEAAAETQKIYVQKASQWAFQVGKTTRTYDDYNVTPANQATANLYVYTPHVGNAPELGIIQPYGANKLFWRIWHKYFSNQKFLDGQVITYNGIYYAIKNNAKRKFISKDIFLTYYKESDAINASIKDLSAYPDAGTIEHANNSLVRSSKTNYIYLLTDLTKRPLSDDSALAMISDFRIAATASEVPTVAETSLAAFTPGSFISNTTVYPQGKLFKDPNGQIWLIQDGAKKAVDPFIWQNRFDSAPADLISQNVIDAYAAADPVKLKDGTFVNTNGKYYLISNGERMRIDDLGVFDRVFGINKKTSALSISTAVLEVHSAGENIDYIDDTLVDPPTNTVVTPVTPVGNFAASFNGMTPEGLLMVGGQTEEVTLTFKNTGLNSWNNTNVWLEATDKGSNKSSFNPPVKIRLNENTASQGQNGSFTFELTAPTDQVGILTEDFTMYYGSDSDKKKITSFGKFIIIRSGDSAQIVEHDLPIAVRNTWKPIDVTMMIKNTSQDLTWLSRRTALEVYNSDGTSSIFYDPNDWVREEVAAVPINQSTIAPGEVGEFKFTIDPRNIKPNTYILGFKLQLLDKDKTLFLNGRDEWRREIRVD